MCVSFTHSGSALKLVVIFDFSLSFCPTPDITNSFISSFKTHSESDHSPHRLCCRRLVQARRLPPVSAPVSPRLSPPCTNLPPPSPAPSLSTTCCPTVSCIRPVPPLLKTSQRPLSSKIRPLPPLPSDLSSHCAPHTQFPAPGLPAAPQTRQAGAYTAASALALSSIWNVLCSGSTVSG